jgi:hypothetical protein
MSLQKIVKKMLMEEPFNINGYIYDFLSIELDEGGWAYDIVVNVILPEKGQSYATPVFSEKIHEILVNIWKYVGTSFSYSEKILVNGKPPKNEGLFISREKQREFLSTIRKEFPRVKLKTAIGNLEFNVVWKPSEKFYSLSDVYIDFNLNIEISNFKLNGEDAKPNLDIASDVSGAILNVMYDSDSLRDKLNNVVYDVMSDEIDIIGANDLYYQVLFYISKVDGFNVDERWGNHFDLEPNMFI